MASTLADRRDAVGGGEEQAVALLRLAPETGTRARAVAATLRCFARYGVAKTTVDDVAREAACSRATLYRAFPGGKDELVAAVVTSEVAGFFRRLRRDLEDVADLEELLVAAVVSAIGQLEGHEALRTLVAHEPELIWPHVAFRQLDRVLALAAAFFEPYLVERLDLEDARRLGEWIARIVLSHVVCPSAKPTGPVASLDEAGARRLVRAFVLPGIAELEFQHHQRLQHDLS